MSIIHHILLFILLTVFVISLTIFVIFILIPLAFIFASWYMKIKERKIQRRKREGPNVAFFHPYANAGGGGERVLWCSIVAVLKRYPNSNIIIYTGDVGVDEQAILNKAHKNFNLVIDKSQIQFVFLTLRSLIEAKNYPHFTLLLQSLGSMALGLEALLKLNPDIYIDTTGVAFTLPIFKYMGGCSVATYLHYPTITSTMMHRVQHRVVAYNNASIIARNPLFSWLKLVYYRIFGWLYARAGRSADIVMVNGTWTEDHINELWNIPFKVHRVYPPCDVSQLKSLRPLATENDPIRILSVAQYRPEKDHPLMLQAMYELRNLLVKNEELWNKIRLVFVGSCRNAEDEERVRNLQDLAKHLSLENSVEFHVNVSYSKLLEYYQNSTLAIHAMWNEHFGISVVESMAAGLIIVAHQSGGPLCDIIETSQGSRTGFLATEPIQYARAILEIIALDKDERKKIIEAARASVERFSEREFEKTFLRTIDPLMIED